MLAFNEFNIDKIANNKEPEALKNLTDWRVKTIGKSIKNTSANY
jgi:hypothetical protein